MGEALDVELVRRTQQLTASCVAAVSCDLDRKMIASGGVDVALTGDAEGKEELRIVLATHS